MDQPLDAYQLFQLEKYGNILPEDGVVVDSFEQGIEELNRHAEWLAENAELQIINHY